ncbi:cytochrome P450 [Tanacetum coccineum]|uniref:Cytochrome P450 n=1 Tax=Tanacetum coccineum TaxID=301880 RepID=A0ABQ5EQX4_9ASTR
MGDFNSITHLEDKLHCTIDEQNMLNFNDFISNANLFDVPIHNYKFTRFGRQGKRSRIDRMLVNAAWISTWPNAKLVTGEKEESDHLPIIWGPECRVWGPRPFRFNNDWFRFPDFEVKCKQWWEGNGMIYLDDQIKSHLQKLELDPIDEVAETSLMQLIQSKNEIRDSWSEDPNEIKERHVP